MTFAFANNVSVIVVLPLTYKEESILAFSLSALKLILLLNEMVSRANRLLSIAEVSDIFNFVLILLLNEIVSLAIRLDSITDVSEIFNFRVEDAILAFFNESILLDNEMVS